jgi:glycosidase
MQGKKFSRIINFCLILLLLVTACSTSNIFRTGNRLVSGTDGYPWWNDTTFYEIFVRSFYDGNGDGKGDFKGLIDKLDYLNDGNPNSKTSLGITGIWLMPIQPSPTYHGYDVTDYMGINPDYGTMDDFKQFLQEAHKRGIRVIIDFVLNHTSNQHPWFIASEDPGSDKRNWYIWSDTNPGYLGPGNQIVWHPAPSGGFYYGLFSDTMPDLNYRNPAVTQAMENVASFWLKDVGVDGLRLDAAKYLVEDGKVQQNTTETHNWYKDFRTFYKGLNAGAMTIGEVADTADTEASYAQGDQLDLVFDFDLASAIISGVNNRDSHTIVNAFSYDLPQFKPGQFGSFLTNHDQDRVMSQMDGNVEKMKAAAAIYLTGPGVPFIYYGEEIGMTGKKPDERIRTPMEWTTGVNAGFTTVAPWEAINTDYQAVNVASEIQDATSLFSWYRSLIQLRNNHPALRIGDYDGITTNNSGVYAALRVSKEETILILINLQKQPITNYSLALSKSSSKGNFNLHALLGEGSFANLTINDQGGFSNFQPLAEIPANGILVIQFSPTR